MGKVGTLSRYVEPMNLGLMCLCAYYVVTIYILRMSCVLILQVHLRVPWPTGTLFPKPCPSYEGHLHLRTPIGLSMAMRFSDCLEQSLRAYIYALPSL